MCEERSRREPREQIPPYPVAGVHTGSGTAEDTGPPPKTPTGSYYPSEARARPRRKRR
jgi:hypothetical protein